MGLSSREMDDEPYEEYLENKEMIRLDMARAKIDNSIAERAAAFTKQTPQQR